MMNRFVSDSVQKLFRVQVTTEESVDKAAEQNRPIRQIHTHHVERSAFDANAAAPEESKGGSGRVQKTVKRNLPKVGRNDLCPCGSGKKYKKCCGA